MVNHNYDLMIKALTAMNNFEYVEMYIVPKRDIQEILKELIYWHDYAIELEKDHG